MGFCRLCDFSAYYTILYYNDVLLCLLYVEAIIAYKFIYVLTDNKKNGAAPEPLCHNPYA